MKSALSLLFPALTALAACNGSTATGYSPPPPPPPHHFYITYFDHGDSATVGVVMDEFRDRMGGNLNAPNAPPAASGRREINWDGVPAALTNVDTFPLNFFNVNSKRGAVYTTPGTGIRIDSTSFASVDTSLRSEFKAFSGKKLFMPVGSNQVSVDFKLVGTTTTGLVNGFGVVFSDVDRAGSTRIEYFDAAGNRIADIPVPAHSGSQEFTFIGAVFDSSLVARVRVTSGEAALDATSKDLSRGGTKDLVVMDDFIYGEPQLLP